MSALFDAYIMVDWSAAAKPVTGANSIWIGTCVRSAAGRPGFSSYNPATRLAARQQILDIAQPLIQSGQRVLIGFDFAMGYPAGTANALGLDIDHSAPWRVLYDFLSARIRETPDNANARFALAGEMNARIGNQKLFTFSVYDDTRWLLGCTGSGKFVSLHGETSNVINVLEDVFND